MRGDHARDVVLGDVCDLVRDYAGKFGFTLCGQQQPGMDADVAARQGEGIDAGIVDDKKREITVIAGADGDELVAQLVQVGYGFRDVEIARVAVHIVQDGASERGFVLIGKILA